MHHQQGLVDVPSFSHLLQPRQHAYPVKAWSSRPSTAESPQRPHTASGQRSTAVGSDVNTDDDSRSMLEAETRYLPVSSELSSNPSKLFHFDHCATRPRTAPPASEQGSADGYSHRHHERSSSNDSPGSGSMSKYDALENRPVKSRMSVNIASVSPKISPKAGSEGIGRPTPSDLNPKPHQRKRSASPVTRAINFTDDSESDAKSQTAADLKAFKLILASTGKKTSVIKTKSANPVEALHGSTTAPGNRPPQQYTPEKYSTPTRKSLYSQGAHHSADLKESPTAGTTHSSNAALQYSSGQPYAIHSTQEVIKDKQNIGSQNTSESAINKRTERDKPEEWWRAAVKIQSVWRGYYTRQYNAQVLRVRIQLRSQRAAEHIRVLKAEVQRQTQLYEKEKSLRSIQLETLRYLVKEVQSLQHWKGEILSELERSGALLTDRQVLDAGVQSSTDFMTQSSQQLLQSLHRASLHREEGFSLVPKKSELSPHPTLSSPLLNASSHHSSLRASAKETELENICKSLQKQVSELQQVLTSMSNYVFQGGAISADKRHTAENDEVKISLEFAEDKVERPPPPPPSVPPLPPQSGAFKSSQSITLSSTVKKPPAPGIPTSPSNLRMQEHGPNSVILQWEASVIYDEHGEISEQPIIGYSILVNGSPKGMVTGSQTRALLEGLQSKTTYRMTVKAVSSFGESGQSNTTVFHPLSEPSEGGNSQQKDVPDHERAGGGKAGDCAPQSGSVDSAQEFVSVRRRRSSASSAGSPAAGSENQMTSRDTDSITRHAASPASTPKNKSPMHVQFDLSLPCPTDTGNHALPSPKEKYSKTFPPTHQTLDSTGEERKGRRQTVIEQLKLSKNLSLSRENSSESLTAKSEENFRLGLASKDVEKFVPDIDFGRMTKEDIVKCAIEKGWITTDDILRMAMKMTKRKASVDIQTPLKAFGSDEMQKCDDNLNDSGSSSKKDTSSKIPVYKGKQFESSNESIDMPIAKDKTHQAEKSLVKESRHEMFVKRVERRPSQKSNENRIQKVSKKYLDSSESESCSPQVSPCNTSSGISLNGTTGSESSGTEHNKKRSPEMVSYHKKTRSSSLEIDVAKFKKEKETFAAARRISLTKPNPPPIPPPSQESVRPNSLPKSEPDEQSENETSTTLTLSLSPNQESENVVKSHTSHCHSTDSTHRKKGSSPQMSRKNRKEEKGYSPSFHDSRKVILRREGSFDSIGSDSHPSSPLLLRKVESAPGIIASSDERFQKIVQSDGSIVYKSYRHVSIDNMSDQSDADMSREIMNETFTVELPGSLPDHNESSKEKRDTPDDFNITKTTVIDSEVQSNANELKLILDSESSDDGFRRGRRGRASHRSPRRRSKERNKEKRSLSVGAVMRKLNQRKANMDKAEKETKEVVKDKPPKPPTGRSPSSGRSPVREDAEFRRPSRRRTVSEQGPLHCASDSDDTSAALNQRPPKHRSKSRERNSASRERSSERDRSAERRSRSRDLSSERSSESRERQSEASSEGEIGASQRSEKSSPSPRRKTFMKHQRSGSDLSNIVALPDRPESPSPRRPAPPSTPKKALNSPRVRRSSSFSRSAETVEKDSTTQKASSKKSTVRQCISLETLKAAKSQSQEMINTESAHGVETGDVDVTLSETEDDVINSTMQHKHRSVSSEDVNEATEHAGQGPPHAPPRTSTMRRSGSLRDDRLLYLSKYKNEFRSDDEMGLSTPRMGLRDYQDGVGYSPRLSGRKDEEPKQQRRIKLGTKAADLFAKLQMKLSNGKNREPESPTGS